MAAAPMYVQQRVVGVLNLASRDPHAFDRWALWGADRGAWAGSQGARCQWRGISWCSSAAAAACMQRSASRCLPAAGCRARRSRLVWLLALVLAPFVAALEYTTQVGGGPGLLKCVLQW